MDPTFQPQNQNDTPNEIGLDASATSTSLATPVTSATPATSVTPTTSTADPTIPTTSAAQVIPRWVALSSIAS